jgi:hypothetical protein
VHCAQRARRGRGSMCAAAACRSIRRSGTANPLRYKLVFSPWA